VDVLWVGAAPGNAGGRGRGERGAHGTRIPFGGDVAGANLEVLLGSIGLDRNGTFIVAAYNQLPAPGGGEPSVTELKAPVGDYPSSVHLLRDTLAAAAPRLVVALGTVAARCLGAALVLSEGEVRLPAPTELARAGWSRNAVVPASALAPRGSLADAWAAGRSRAPHLLWLTHPSAQNMSPFAGRQTAFHTRMREARRVLRRAARGVLGWSPPRRRAATPSDGIYALPEWRERIAPYHARLDALWRAHGL
jgi:uracil-DNA glycosylase